MPPCLRCSCAPVSLLGAAAAACAAPAPDYPQRPIRMIVGLPAGGSFGIKPD